MTHKIRRVRVEKYAYYVHRSSQGGAKGAMARPNVWKTVILCFGRRFSKQNSVVRLKSNISAPSKFLGWLLHWLCQQTSPKRWFGNMSMTSNCDVTSSAHQIQMNTICHCVNPPMNFFFVHHCREQSVDSSKRYRKTSAFNCDREKCEIMPCFATD